ncbi:MAG: 2-oxoacid:acceptor oxidoreductase family protein [Candidatus Thorarchaeota archaeon]|nr:MAG: 2-oxoacid:acceptor oxidoreductase family protein [Candidatus Thorarchaeota archaeon]
MRNEIRIGGSGGMGVVLAGVILGHAAVVHAGLNAVQSQSYGPEARGTAAKSEVIISDEPIRFPKVRDSDYLIAMNQDAFNKYLERARDGSTVIVDPDLVTVGKDQKEYDFIPVPAMATADGLGLRLVSNMVMLGALTAKAGMFSIQAVEKAIADIVPSKFQELDIKAVRAGSELV